MVYETDERVFFTVYAVILHMPQMLVQCAESVVVLASFSLDKSVRRHMVSIAE